MTSPAPPFRRIRLGLSNAYLVESQRKGILVDAGSRHRERAFLCYLRRHNLAAHDIELIVITHAHFDHVGSLKAIQQLCDCPVAIHEREAGLLKDGLVVVPPGTNLFGKIASYVGKRLMRPCFRFPAVKPDILISEDLSLEPFGFPGKILCTKGHTQGSLSVLLPSGEAFVGDLAANYLPLGLGPLFPPFAEDISDLLTSWQRLLSLGAQTICPGHGKPFKAQLLTRRLG